MAGYIIRNKLFSVIFTIFCLVGLINAVNFIDGINGLASGKIIIASGAIFWLSTVYNEPKLQILSLSMLSPHSVCLF